LEVEEMFETLTVAQIREVREGRRERGAAQRRRLFFFSIGASNKTDAPLPLGLSLSPFLKQAATKTEAEVEDARRQLCALVGDSYR
jgi:hypothetical protein